MAYNPDTDPRLDPRIKALLPLFAPMGAPRDVASREDMIAAANSPEALAAADLLRPVAGWHAQSPLRLHPDNSGRQPLHL